MSHINNLFLKDLVIGYLDVIKENRGNFGIATNSKD